MRAQFRDYVATRFADLLDVGEIAFLQQSAEMERIITGTWADVATNRTLAEQQADQHEIRLAAARAEIEAAAAQSDELTPARLEALAAIYAGEQEEDAAMAPALYLVEASNDDVEDYADASDDLEFAEGASIIRLRVDDTEDEEQEAAPRHRLRRAA